MLRKVDINSSSSQQNLVVSKSHASDQQVVGHIRSWAKLLADAIDEACEWKLPKVIVWSPNAEVGAATRILKEDLSIEEHSFAA